MACAVPKAEALRRSAAGAACSGGPAAPLGQQDLKPEAEHRHKNMMVLASQCWHSTALGWTDMRQRSGGGQNQDVAWPQAMRNVALIAGVLGHGCAAARGKPRPESA